MLRGLSVRQYQKSVRAYKHGVEAKRGKKSELEYTAA